MIYFYSVYEKEDVATGRSFDAVAFWLFINKAANNLHTNRESRPTL
jgi:hypothetical protein